MTLPYFLAVGISRKDSLIKRSIIDFVKVKILLIVG